MGAVLAQAFRFFVMGFSLCFVWGFLAGVKSRFEAPSERLVMKTIYSRLHVHKEEKPLPDAHAANGQADGDDDPVLFSYKCGEVDHYRYSTRTKVAKHVAYAQEHMGAHSLLGRMAEIEAVSAFSSGIEMTVIGERLRVSTERKWPAVLGLVFGSFSGYFAGYSVAGKIDLACEDDAITKVLSDNGKWNMISHASLLQACEYYGRRSADVFRPLVTDDEAIKTTMDRLPGWYKPKGFAELAEWRRADNRVSHNDVQLTWADVEGCVEAPYRLTAQFTLAGYYVNRNAAVAVPWVKRFQQSPEQKSADVLSVGNVFAVVVMAALVICGLAWGLNIVREAAGKAFDHKEDKTEPSSS